MKLSSKTKALVAGLAATALSSVASAHVWQIGWDSNTDGSVDFYGVSYHGNLNANYDDFVTNPAGFVINGAMFSFDTGSVVDLEDTTGAAGTSGTVSTIWNNLGLDGSLDANAGSANGGSYNGSTSRYGKYASVNLDSAALASIGITAGSNSVTLTTFANNVDWDGLPFSSATVPINIVVQPPSPVPEPSSLALLGLGMAGLGFARRRKADK